MVQPANHADNKDDGINHVETSPQHKQGFLNDNQPVDLDLLFR
jgi:hypothetical protein